MQKADSGLKKVTVEGVQRVADTLGAGNAEPVDNSSRYTAGRDHIDAINQMFAEFELAYHNQYHKAYAQDKSVGIAKKYWLSCLSPYQPQIILKATRNVVASQEYLPSVATIVQACEEVMTLPGLPSAHEAYVEACCASQPKAEYQWSHAVVYQAGKNTGWFELANQFENRIFPLFEYHYQLLCKRLFEGEDISLTVPQALPDSKSSEMTAAEKKTRLAQLRKELDF